VYVDNAEAALPPPKLGRLLRLRVKDPLLLIIAALLIWQAVASWTQSVALSPPLTTFTYISQLVLTARFWENVGATAGAFVMAFAISAAAGLLLGLLLGLRRFAADVAEPVLAGFYTIPKVTLYPVVLLLCGLGMSAKVTFGVMHGLVPVTLFTLGAIRTLPAVLPRAARSMRLSPWQTMRWVLFPACLPQVTAGLRLGFSLSLLGVLIGEMFSSQRGLGFLLVSGLAQNNVPLSTSVVLVIVVFAIVANAFILRLSRRAASGMAR
jgi:NitT/TauT family transport system permease protein